MEQRVPFKGFTLIEVVIGIFILSLMLLLAGYAFNQILYQYQKISSEGIGIGKFAKILWLQKSFAGAIDYYVFQKNKSWFPYFVGTQEEISYVTISPIAHNIPTLVFIKKQQEKNGKFSLLYYEMPVYAMNYEDIKNIEMFKKYEQGIKIPLIENIEEIKFEYYGYDLFENTFKYFETFDSSKLKVIPLNISIIYKKEGQQYKLIFHTYVNSLLKRDYERIYPQK